MYKQLWPAEIMTGLITKTFPSNLFVFLIKDLYFVFCRHIVWLSSLDIMAEWTTTKKTVFLPVDCLKSRWVRSYFGLKRLLDITPGKLRRSFSGLINYQELPRLLRFGGNSRYIWPKGKLMCITYANNLCYIRLEGSRNVIFKLQRMRSHWAQTRKWTLFFVFTLPI